MKEDIMLIRGWIVIHPFYYMIQPNQIQTFFILTIGWIGFYMDGGVRIYYMSLSCYETVFIYKLLLSLVAPDLYAMLSSMVS